MSHLRIDRLRESSLNERLLTGAIGRTGADGAKRKKGVVDALVGEIQLRLKAIEKFVQAALDDVFRVRVGQLGAQLAEPLLGGIAVHTDRRTRDRVKRVVGRGQAMMDRARKFMIEHEKLYDLLRRDMAVALAIHFERARRSQHRRPLNII